MRILVMLSPTNRYGTKMAYTKLRKYLYSDGYLRIAPEVYMRITNNRKAAQKHLQRLRDYAPPTGTVRILQLTERQFEKTILLTAEPDDQERIVGTNSHITL